MKNILIPILFSSVLFIGIAFISYFSEQKYRIHLGEKFILDGETTTIIDYSSTHEYFQLSNGNRIDKSLIIKD